MGIYFYRVSAKKVICSDGLPANVAVFAYKPYWGMDSEKLNRKMAFKAGCLASENMAKAGKLCDRFVLAGPDGSLDSVVYGNPWNSGVFPDCDLGCKPFPKIPGVAYPAACN